jgi:hypothetical protein
MAEYFLILIRREGASVPGSRLPGGTSDHVGTGEGDGLSRFIRRIDARYQSHADQGNAAEQAGQEKRWGS